MARQVEDSPNLLELMQRWFSRYEHCIRQRDKDTASEMFHPKAVCFPLNSNRTDCPESQKVEWKRWKEQLAFTFDLSSAAILPSAGAIVVALNWTANPLIHGSPRKEGRGTYMFMLFDNGRFACLHEHLSENPE